MFVMLNSTTGSPARTWNSSDLLVRVHDGEKLAEWPTEECDGAKQSLNLDARSESPLNLAFGDPSLVAIEGDEARFESLSVVRSGKPSARHVLGFAARNRSIWAFDVLVSRFTRGAYDWASLRALAIKFGETPHAFEPVLDRIKLDNLWSLCEALHARGMDFEAERGLLQFIATRVVEGRELDSAALESLMENLLNCDLGDEARELFPRLNRDNWMRHALAVDLQHPRFGGSHDSLLVILNEAYRRFGLESVALDADGSTPFERLTARSANQVRDEVLVSVIMTCWSPGPEIFTAVRSIIGQTYQNWELIVMDDASPAEHDAVLAQVGSMDPRIRVIRNIDNAGTYVRRNEALRLARGELVTVQDSDDWSHPRRLEIQVRDLLATPDRFANVIRAARVTEDFSLVSPRGAKLFVSEPSILFRRESVLDLVGYFDTTRKGADTEFRQRLEVATGLPVRVVGPELPLEFMLADSSSLSGGDFGKSLWTAPARLAYRSSTKRYHDQIRSGAKSAKFPFPQGRRLIQAPGRLLGAESKLQQFDLLVVADGHGVRARAEFIGTVVGEIHVAVAAGLSVALLHSDSVTGVQNAGPLAGPLQALVDCGRLTRVFEEDAVEAPVTIVRHAGAAQGHASERLSVVTERVIVVEDVTAGDQRGVTVAKDDVIKTVTAWFGISPEWAIGYPGLPKPELISVVVAGGGNDVRVALRASDPEQIVGVNAIGSESAAAVPNVHEDGVVHAVFEVADLAAGDLEIAVIRDSEVGGIVQRVEITPQSVVTMRAQRVLVPREDGGLHLIPARSETGSCPIAGDFIARYLGASISQATIFRETLELVVDYENETSLSRVYALREVGGVIRRREFTARAVGGDKIAVACGLEDLLDVRWKVFGTFVTPYGVVEAPLVFPEHMQIRDSSVYRIRQLKDDGSGVLHVVPTAITRGEEEVPLLSVIMPVFNVAIYLDTAIRSVLTQDLTDLELIIIDDASTDNSRHVIEMHRKLDSRVRVIELDHNTLGGAGIPSNLGIRAARGKYLAFVDSDDWVTSGIFTKLVSTADEYEAQLVVGDFRTFGDSDRRIVDAYDASAWRDIPLGEVISAYTHPALLRLSAVPWRKLYRRDLLTEHRILYPEGDYFYEDNPLHWFVLSRADRVVAIDEIISFHRMEREGQTMGASQYKLGAVGCHANTIYNFLVSTEHEGRDVLFTEFFAYMERLKWAVKRQVQSSASKLIQRGLASTYDKALATAPTAEIGEATRTQFNEYRAAYGEVDLTVVMPVYNSADMLRDSLDSVLRLGGISYNVLVVDDGSDDGSFKIMSEYETRHGNVHVFRQNNRGAGRARNSVIPLATGRYTYFLDSDDVIDPMGLRDAVAKADADEADLLFFKYRIDYVDEGRSQGMFKGDKAIWDQLVIAPTHTKRQKLVASLINYPWNRIIRTSLLHDANIFFGPTVVHNDVLFHWHSALAATNIGILDVEVCVHRKFKARAQVTNIADERRMAVLEALRGTHQRISDLDSYENTEDEWQRFAAHLLEWAENLIPDQLRPTYRKRSETLALEIRG